ncbi:hypothetical protein SAMN05216573_12394 [Bradyrhizobium sp. Rc3b]|nr:hypothetical protein SAMN05216573_12394 [Bradyrhizobium sp. Rc3b]
MSSAPRGQDCLGEAEKLLAERMLDSALRELV